VAKNSNIAASIAFSAGAALTFGASWLASNAEGRYERIEACYTLEVPEAVTQDCISDVESGRNDNHYAWLAIASGFATVLAGVAVLDIRE
jgi:hypothetical protein